MMKMRLAWLMSHVCYSCRTGEGESHHLRAGAVPSEGPLVICSGFTSKVGANSLPVWVAETLTEDFQMVRIDRNLCDFKSLHMEGITSESYDDMYGDKFFTKGHLAPASFHTESLESYCQTFLLNLNIVPQYGPGNHSGSWPRLERLSVKLTSLGKVWIVSGPLFISKEGRTLNDEDTTRIGSTADRPGIPAPTALFKVIAVSIKGKLFTSAFIVNNDEADLLMNPSFHALTLTYKKYDGFTSNFDLIESVTGIDLSAYILGDSLSANIKDERAWAIKEANRLTLTSQTVRTLEELRELIVYVCSKHLYGPRRSIYVKKFFELSASSYQHLIGQPIAHRRALHIGYSNFLGDQLLNCEKSREILGKNYSVKLTEA